MSRSKGIGNPHARRGKSQRKSGTRNKSNTLIIKNTSVKEFDANRSFVTTVRRRKVIQL